ncbi:RBBP9/YdeN family alpha/beta hydrolase [Flexivirga caeni]|uniref:Hydrolase n=1 Tax=Flexivirga caeni TaxID=2294115 RepID=A0A3M9MB90_9MICO|nr:alpha/beta hydrolase [Flexivirga caeni]RNI22816.1 hypothetical protein EFY87_08340 [Flexivirga caeni]
MRGFLLLHGYGNHRPRGHWQRWLAGQLRHRGERVRYPQLPDPDDPQPAAWLDVLDAELDELGNERVVVCHSLACSLWYLAACTGRLSRPADRLLLVAPASPSVLSELGLARFAPELWKANVLAASARSSVRLVASDNDPTCPEAPAAELYGRPLGLDAETLPGAGHLTTADGYGPWPAALGWCLNPAARFASGAPGS